MRFGVHMPQSGGFAKNLKRVAGFGCTTIQIFTSNPTGWRMGKFDEAEIEKRAALIEEYGIYPLVVHAPYLINLATTTPDFLEKSKTLLLETLKRAAFYRAPYAIVHTGNHGGAGPEKGLLQVIKSLEELLRDWPEDVELLLENTAGSGTAIGADFNELGEIIKALTPGPFGVCIDTAHGFAAGYDFGTPEGVKKVLDTLGSTVGLDRVKVIHVNDTKVELGSKVDRHAHLGEGNITLEALAELVNFGWPDDFPFILETPDMGTEMDEVNLNKLKGLVR